VDEGPGRGAILGHFDLGLKIIPRLVTELERDLVAMDKDVVQDRNILVAREIKAHLLKMLARFLLLRCFFDGVVVESNVCQDGVGIVTCLDTGRFENAVGHAFELGLGENNRCFYRDDIGLKIGLQFG